MIKILGKYIETKDSSRQDFEESKKDTLYILLITGIVTMVFAPFIFLGYMYLSEEHFGLYYPLSFFYKQAVMGGLNTTWIGEYYGGVPASFEQFISIHFPLYKILFKRLPFFLVHHLNIYLPVLTGVITTYIFGRNTSLKAPAAFVLGISYLTATTFTWINIGPLIAYAFFIQPLLMLSVLKIHFKEKPLIFFIIGSLGLSIGFLAASTQLIFYSSVFAFLFAIYLDWSRKISHGINRFRSSLSLIGMGLIGIIIGSPQILSSYTLVEQSIRNSSFAAQTNAGGLGQFITFLLPEYIKIPFIGGGSPGLYVGALSLVFVLITIFVVRTRLSLFFSFLYLMALGFAYNVIPFSWINNSIPPFSNFSSPLRWLAAGALPLSFLAASGFNSLLEEVFMYKEKVYKLLKILLILLVTFFISILAGLSILYVVDSKPDIKDQIIENHLGTRESNLPFGHYQKFLDNTINELQQTFNLFNWRFTPILLFLFLSIFIIYLYNDKKITREQFVKASILIVSINSIFVFVAQFNVLVPQNIIAQEPTIIKSIKNLESDNKTYRIAGFLIGESIFWKNLQFKNSSELATIQKELVINNSNIYYGVDRIDGLGLFRSLRHNQLLNTVLFPKDLFILNEKTLFSTNTPLNQVTNEHVLSTVTKKKKVEDFLSHIQLLSMLNVKYIYSLIPLNHPNLKAIDHENKLPFQTFLYENTLVLPRIYFAQNVQFSSDDDINLLKKVISVSDFKETTIIECGNCVTNSDISTKQPFTIETYENGKISIKTNSKKDDWLVLSESYSPGWQAMIDGENTAIMRANFLFQAIHIPPGEHTIVFTHEDIGKRNIYNFIK